MSSTEGTLPPTEPTTPEPAPESEQLNTIEKKLDTVIEIEQKLVENVENNNVVLEEVATVTPGVDETKVELQVVDETPVTPEPPAETPPIGSAGSKQITIPKHLKNDPFIKEMAEKLKGTQKDLDAIKKLNDEEKQKEANTLRKAQATSIVEKQILLKQVKEEDKDKEIKKYVELKTEDGQLENLTILDNYLKSTIPKEVEDTEPIGSAGPGYYIPMGSDHGVKSTMTNAEAMD